jgi:gamma-glutamyltranspeptidase/glutathione hydrolase
MRPLPALCLLILFIAGGCNRHEPVTLKTGRDISVSSAMVVSAHPEASLIGAQIMASGGNAVDAAAATEFALAVCHPTAGNIGGGGFMVIRLADGTIDAIDYREKAPGASQRDMFLDEQGNVIEGLSLNTHLSAGVPGTVDGVITAHEKYGRLSFRDVIQPAIDLALTGFPLTENQAASLNSMREVFLQRNDHLVAFVRDIPWQAGDTLRQPDLGHTLERIRDNGREGFYSGVTADMIVAENSGGNGIISAEDLANYHSSWRLPLTITYRGYRIISMPPPSSGGVVLFQLLKMIEKRTSPDEGFLEPSTIHLMAEAEKRAFADRAQYLGDPDYVDIPTEYLLSNTYLEERMKDFSPLASTPSTSISYGLTPPTESEETTHYSVVDKFGNAVAGTTTLNNSYGSAIVVDGAGFILNDEMDDFSIKPGTPNMYGLLGGDANAVSPGKRMLSSMTPTILEKEGKLFLVVGTPGGSTIITSVFQIIRDVVDFNMTIPEAVAAPRFHHQWFPDVISYEEGRIDSLTLEALRKMGHILAPRGPIGRVDAILVGPDGSLNAGADPRGDDSAAGW